MLIACSAWSGNYFASVMVDGRPISLDLSFTFIFTLRVRSLGLTKNASPAGSPQPLKRMSASRLLCILSLDISPFRLPPRYIALALSYIRSRQKCEPARHAVSTPPVYKFFFRHLAVLAFNRMDSFDFNFPYLLRPGSASTADNQLQPLL